MRAAPKLWQVGAIAVTLLAASAALFLLLEAKRPVEAGRRLVKLSGRWDCIDVMGGEYRVCNNVWGTGAGVGRQVIEVDPDSTYFKVVEATHNSQNVAAYPFIYKGCHWGSCTKGSGLPVRVKELRAARSTWSIGVESVGGVWNAAYDIWFSRAGASSPEGGAELMIWINRGGGARPAGRRVATLEIGGVVWEVYYANLSWNYIAFLAAQPLESVDLDIKAFIDEAVRMGYIDPEWFLDAIEAGFEIWRGGVGLTTLSFSASIER
ncbi:MAG: hypothetical protein QXF69_03085 [Thermofilaceae archaeon]